jgi:hypothetical protein
LFLKLDLTTQADLKIGEPPTSACRVTEITGLLPMASHKVQRCPPRRTSEYGVAMVSQTLQAVHLQTTEASISQKVFTPWDPRFFAGQWLIGEVAQTAAL